MRRTLLAIALIGALAGAITVGAKVMSASEDPGAVKRTVAGGDDVAEGLEVHGHWMIEVKNPDGSTAERREFNNDFFGGVPLTDILLRSRTPAPWRVVLHGSSSSSHACTGAGAAFPCTITEADSNFIQKSGSNFLFKTLVKEDLGASFRLRGNATASRDGDIGAVQTQLSSCTPNTSPSNCKSGTEGPFTSTNITPVNVLNGQQVLVVVTISFS